MGSPHSLLSTLQPGHRGRGDLPAPPSGGMPWEAAFRQPREQHYSGSFLKKKKLKRD